MQTKSSKLVTNWHCADVAYNVVLKFLTNFFVRMVLIILFHARRSLSAKNSLPVCCCTVIVPTCFCFMIALCTIEWHTPKLEENPKQTFHSDGNQSFHYI
ncbi:hypothetical protein NPIL_65241 [Nephila pilipes]|uniref:Uncharacterized protein n=1 Tax=Nephila pilipes TaxID=299642 RepID=A0A8X6N190_NEPPI|nr:hypothetical protein NPIL_65241 [Nephila pilipes]